MKSNVYDFTKMLRHFAILPQTYTVKHILKIIFLVKILVHITILIKNVCTHVIKDIHNKFRWNQICFSININGLKPSSTSYVNGRIKEMANLSENKNWFVDLLITCKETVQSIHLC